MTDLLTLLDHAIDELTPAGSSRCSRSQKHAEMRTGTVNSLETNAVPVVPVVPVPKQETRGDISQTAESTLAGDHAERRIAHARIPLNQREQRELQRIHYDSQTLSSSRCGSDRRPANGNNGNGSRHVISGHKFGLAASARDQSDLQDFYEERAAIAEFEGGIPRIWAEGFARLQMMTCPAGIRPARWQEVIDDAGRFLDGWAMKAAALGWDTASVFGVHAERPVERVDCAGLVWLLRGDEVIAITADMARIRTRTGALQTYHRRPWSGDGRLLWEFCDDGA